MDYDWYVRNAGRAWYVEGSSNDGTTIRITCKTRGNACKLGDMLGDTLGVDTSLPGALRSCYTPKDTYESLNERGLRERLQQINQLVAETLHI